jgi:glycosyltransferase involved in cell wall biosynthesis
MRISVLCTDLGVRVPGEKGASMHLMSITSAFAAVGHQVQLIGVAGHESPPASFSSPLTDIHLLPHPGRSHGLQRELNKLSFVEHVIEHCSVALQRFDPHVVYERLSLFGSAGRRLVDNLPKAQHVLEVNALLAEEDAAWRGLHLADLATTLERRVLHDADIAVAVSAEVAHKIKTVAPRARCIVVENGAEVERFRDLPSRATARRRLGLPAAATFAAFIGALRPWHGVDVAIYAIARTPHVHLVVVGDGPVRADLYDLAEELGVLHRVHFLGQRAHEDVAACLAAADMALAPYPATDGFSFSPLKLYEYLAAGTPVIASAIGQIPAALANGHFGTLVPPGDVDALASAMLRVPFDRACAERAGIGRQHALAHHGWNDRARRIAASVEAADAMA